MSKELLFSVTKKDLKIDYFSGTGSGGQHRNKHQNCVRMYHKDSGARSTGQSSRERKSNLKEAFKRLTESSKFKIWLNERVYEEVNQTNIEKEVKKSMSSEKLLIECKEENKWKEIK
jgi:protein subunit release factor A